MTITGSILGTNTPALTSTTFSDGGPIGWGIRFVSTTGGTINKVRYYVANTTLATDCPTAHAVVWDAGAPFPVLYETDFAIRSTAGWQEVVLPTPIPLVAGKEYAAGIQFPSSVVHYGATSGVTFPRSSPTVGALSQTYSGFRDGASYDGYPAGTTLTTDFLVDVEVSVSPSAPSVTVPADVSVPIGGSNVTLTASPTASAPSTITSVAWTLVSGGPMTLLNTTSPTVAVVPPSSIGDRRLRCTVTSSDGLTAYAELVVHVVLPNGVTRTPAWLRVDEGWYPLEAWVKQAAGWVRAG